MLADAVAWANLRTVIQVQMHQQEREARTTEDRYHKGGEFNRELL